MLKKLLDVLLMNKEENNSMGYAAGEFVQTNKGATDKIIQFIQEKRLLTS